MKPRTERLPPQNVEAEEAVLGALLINPEGMSEIIGKLSPESFYKETHGMIFGAMAALYEASVPVDFLTICDQLERRNILAQVGGPARITKLINSTPTSMHLAHYAEIVDRTAVKRQLIEVAGKIAVLAYDDEEDAREAMDKAESLLFAIGDQSDGDGMVPISDVAQEVFDRTTWLAANQGMLQGVPTGFKDIDELLGGFQPSDLIIVAGRPAMGKTSFALNIAQRAANRHGHRIGFFSLEMSDQQLTQRMIAGESGISTTDIRRGRIKGYEKKFALAVHDVGLLHIHIDDTPAISILELRARARRLYSRYGLDLIVVDYLQLMQGTGRRENRVQEISAISGGLKALARELDLPVVALSQLNRGVESRKDKRPMLADLRESGALEQDADVVMFVYREEMYNEYTDRKNIADIIISKHRQGPTGTCSLYFDKPLTTFRDVDLRRTELPL